MARTSPKRIGTGKRVIGPKTRFAPDLLALEDRSVPAFIYVDSFTAGQGGHPAQDFNPSGTGPLGTVAASQLTFVATGTPAGTGGVTGTGKFAVPDITTAFNSARDNPGADTILLAPGVFALDNTQGQSLTLGTGFNDNSYFFNTDPLSILGSGKGLSTIQPQADVYDGTNADTESDPLLAVRKGATFVASDFTLDGSQAKIGIGIRVVLGTDATLTNVAVNNFVAVDGLANGGSPFGFGVSVEQNAGGFVSVTNGSFSGNARAGVNFFQANGQVVGSTFTGRGAGAFVDYGLQATGTSDVYVTGSTFTDYNGAVQGGNNPQSAALVAAQGVDDQGNLLPGGAVLIVAGNKITGNVQGVVTGSDSAPGTDTSVAVVNYNDLSNNTVALEATQSARGPSVLTGVTAGIDGRFNYFGGTGPARAATEPTGSIGDATVNPTGTGSGATGNVRIDNVQSFAPATKSVANPAFTADPTDTAGATAAIRAALVPTVGATLKIYVDPTFTGTPGSAPNQAFNAGGVGQPSVAASGLKYIAGGTTYGSTTVPAGTDASYAVADLTTAMEIARDNPGADTIYLAASATPYALNNANGGGDNGYTYIFSGATNDLNIVGSGIGNSVIRPTSSTFLPGVPAAGDTSFDPVINLKAGADTTSSGFTFDGTLGKFGGGIAVSGAGTPTNASFTGVALRNFVADDGSTTNGFTSGYGLFVAPDTGGLVAVRGSQFSGNGRYGIGTTGDETGSTLLQVYTSTFTGRGAGNLVDYGVQVQGNGKAYITGSTFSGYQGKAGVDQTESAAISAAQGTNSNGTTPFAGGGQILAVGNKVTGNALGIAAQDINDTGAATVDARFNDLSNNATALETTNAGATVTAPNNYFGGNGPSGTAFTGGTGAGVVGAVTVTNIRPVTAPTIDVTSAFATAATPTLATAAPQAGTDYVTDPRIQSSFALTGTSPASGSDLVVTVNYAEALAKNLAGTAYTFDPSLITASFTNSKGATTALTSSQYTVTGPAATGNGKSATVTVTAATLAALGPVGVITVTSGPSSGTAGTGNAQLTASGNQTGNGSVPNASDSLAVPFGSVSTGLTITPNPATTAVLTPTAPSVTSTFTVTPSTGRTVASVTATSNNAAVTVTRVAGSPNTAPQFTVTSSSTAPGSAVVTVTATDSDGLTASSTIPVTYGVANSGVTLAPINNLTFQTNGAAQNVSTTVTYSPGRTGTVTFSVSPNSLVTVTQGGTSTAPTFTVTPVAGAVGSGVVTVKATDSDGISNSTAFAVQVGTGVAPTITGLPDTTIPYNGSTGPLTVNIGGANTPLTVTATSSNTGVATVAVTGTGTSRTVTVTANPALTTGGSTSISLRVTDAQGLTSVQSFNVTVAPQRVRLFAVGAGPGSAPVVQVYGQNGQKLFGFTAFELSFTGGVSVATGDVNGDGVDDIIAGASVGGGPRIRVIDGKTGAEIANFFAFESSTRTGVNVAAGKLVGGTANPVSASGFYREQIVVGSAEGGGPRVSTFDVLAGQGANPSRLANFFAYEDSFRNGATVAAGDLNGDGIAEIITGSGEGGGPRVRAFTAAGASAGVDFFAFDQSLRNGISVAAGPLDTTGKASIIVGTGPNGGSVVRVFSSTGTQTTQFTAYGDTPNASVRVGTAQFTASGPEAIVTGPGVGGGPLVKVFTASNPGAGSTFADFSFEQPFRGGIFVG